MTASSTGVVGATDGPKPTMTSHWICANAVALSAPPSSLSPLPPKSPKFTNQNLSTKRHKSNLLLPPATNISRRDAAALFSFLGLLPSLCRPDPAAAFSIGISGPKDWLKEQKRKSAKFLLVPIDASREVLRSAYQLLTSGPEYTDVKLEEVQKLLRSAGRDCVPQERNWFVAFQANTGVEVCTFRLIVNNASSLLGKNDPVKLEAEAILSDLIRSFTSLYGLANETDIQLASERQRVADALMDTISSLDKFEQGVKDCLEV